MPRHARQARAGFIYHALNRATARLKLFRKPADYNVWACSPQSGHVVGHGNNNRSGWKAADN
jgi:hypothetical protein